MPIAIEIYETPRDRSLLHVDINGERWISVGRPDLTDTLAEIGRAYAAGELARLLKERDQPT